MAEVCEKCGKKKILLFNLFSCPDGGNCKSKDDGPFQHRGNKFLCPKCGSSEVEPFPHHQMIGLFHCWQCGGVWITD